MRIVKRMVCLANSRKVSGRCIAGIELDQYGQRLGWLRPVSSRPTREVSDRERRYPDGNDPRVLDILEVPLLRPLPEEYQQENWLLDPSSSWHYVGRFPFEGLPSLLDPPSPLWIDGYHTVYGRNDRVPYERAKQLSDSLRLLHVESLTLVVFAPYETFGDPRRRVQGRFVHSGVEYRLWVTDPVYERTYLANPDGLYRIEDSYLTVSLGEPYEGYCYKLIAAVIEREGAQPR
ncbi:MAG: hypothetical protein J7450_12705 [Thermomicrobium sp.]|uniref:dual OB domain-containing protein n=1 Tax=Thermomicrobium sp. TaxID=1969469 RepID=UPI001B155162|nr:hypothetical protein [Thermomicrobium sp.]MBO9360405.1 hypothetical protein [Thermomicrobium sp.]